MDCTTGIVLLQPQCLHYSLCSQLGYYMSVLWIARAINLLLFLPRESFDAPTTVPVSTQHLVVISYFKPKPSDSTNPSIFSELRFDNILSRCSLFVDGAADALIAVIPGLSQPSFVALSCLSSFTSGGNPAMHSLGAVCLHAEGRSSEVGSLFGALAFVGAVAHIISASRGRICVICA